MKKTLIITLLLPILLFSGLAFSGNPADSKISHSEWNALLNKFVNTDGMVDYSGLIKEKTKIQAYLEMLGQNMPDDSWTNNEKLTYWINAYNAFTVDLITRNYSLKSIMDIEKAWDIKFIQIGGKTYSLNEIEHEIIRKEFNEPRIHFALVCAAVSCPPLLNEAYKPEKLESQLQDQTVKFINNPDKNNIRENSAKVSQIFNWFKDDFTKEGTLQEYLNKYSKTKLDSNAKIEFMDYSWELNDQR